LPCAADLALSAGDFAFEALGLHLNAGSLASHAALVRPWGFFWGEVFVLVSLDFFATDRIANELLTDAFLAN